MVNEFFVQNNTVGMIANGWIPEKTTANILGHTSSGLFLQLPEEQKIIYLTNYPDFGPINLNITPPLPELWNKGKTINIYKENGTIRFHYGQKTIRVENYDLWKNPPPTPYTIHKETFNQRIKKITNQLTLIKGSHGFVPLFSNLFNNNPNPQTDSLTVQIWETIQHLKKACLNQDQTAFLSFVTPLLSFGRGLTPSGDDFLCGFIYCLTRKSTNHSLVKFLESVKIALLSTAAARTTSISVSLLTCAFMGEAHNRTQAMTDVLTTEEISLENQAMRMAGWGSSSGADTTLGIIIASQILQVMKEGNE